MSDEASAHLNRLRALAAPGRHGLGPDDVAAIEWLLECRDKLAAACRRALDAQRLDADAYEKKYFPMTGPMALVNQLAFAVEDAGGDC